VDSDCPSTVFLCFQNFSQFVTNKPLCFVSVVKQFAVPVVDTAQVPGSYTLFKSKSVSEVRDSFDDPI
jgi:hypothetical protein